MKVLLSIKPEYASKILSGEKKFEFRKVSFTNSEIKTVVIYATKPVGKVVGEFEVLKIYSDSPTNIWKRTKRYAGIDKKYFDSYYEGKSLAVAIAVGAVHEYEKPKNLSDIGVGISPPQSFCYIKAADCDQQRELELV
ncbi:Predicted transcriptional regulator, contains an HTH and PUA-like domains [Pseudomonas frederiksbergensis]|uniref:Predicted transcriptional regulator, contains an HTH and PUA-like domains n=1 Tax=Pseudomonas frederiksbergensis TaxID=104087 RepID=A0A1H4S788_9PSED|nr:ASCH domain-containing protein [Pseudomonas frederiksbergensis]SEC39949.1 Predicted transcriptional regulator, contains an HTH and PUA-like domains [Pseudomonas frederiksbergensis]